MAFFDKMQRPVAVILLRCIPGVVFRPPSSLPYMPLSFDFHSKTVVVTGASGGIGSAVATKFGLAGANLLLHVNKNVYQHAGQSVPNFTGDQMVVADFSSPAEIAQFLQTINAKTEKIDVWVHAAGIDLMSPRMKNMPFEEKLRHFFQVDVFAPMEIAKKVGQRMKSEGGGVIVLFGWNGVKYGWIGETAELYGAAKGALLGFSRSLAESLAPEVRVRLLSPGWVKTRWGEKTSGDMEARLAADSLQNRWGTPDEIADAVLFFCSQESEFIDGIDVFLDGGKRGS